MSWQIKMAEMEKKFQQKDTEVKELQVWLVSRFVVKNLVCGFVSKRQSE